MLNKYQQKSATIFAGMLSKMKEKILIVIVVVAAAYCFKQELFPSFGSRRF